MEKRFRIFILGAGFSKPAGLPLAPELWGEVRSRAQSFVGRAGKFQQDIDRYLKFKRDSEGIDVDEDDIDFENFCRFLDIEHFLGLKGSDTWSVDGNETTVVIKTLIGTILTERTPEIGDIPQLYLDFAQRLQPDDMVLTFDYDVLLERALEAVDKSYRLFPQRYTSVGPSMAEVEHAIDEVIILKLHGSIDWFDRAEYSRRERQHKEEFGLSDRVDHPVFGSDGDDLRISKLLDGPRFDDDPLEEMHRVHELRRLYARKIMFLATPWLLAPSTMKILYAEKLGSFWYDLGSLGTLNLGLAIVGYSLPPQDVYARQAVYSIVTNYQQEWWDRDVLGDGRKKPPLAIVDLCENNTKTEEFKKRYRFVDWTRADFCQDGFNEDALDRIFNG